MVQSRLIAFVVEVAVKEGHQPVHGANHKWSEEQVIQQVRTTIIISNNLDRFRRGAAGCFLPGIDTSGGRLGFVAGFIHIDPSPGFYCSYQSKGTSPGCRIREGRLDDLGTVKSVAIGKRERVIDEGEDDCGRKTS